MARQILIRTTHISLLSYQLVNLLNRKFAKRLSNENLVLVAF
jgi:hypothetical protein